MQSDIVARRTNLETGCWVEIARDLYQDEHPLRDWDWNGTITLIAPFKGYGNDDEHDLNDEKFLKYLRAVRIFGGVVIPVYYLEHSGLSFKAGRFNDPWDSGWAGCAWMRPKQIREIYKGDKQAAKAHLESMIRVMDARAQNECYGVRAYGSDGEELYACYGFWNTYPTWQKLMEVMAEHVSDDFADMIRDCYCGEIDPLDEIPARYFVPGFAPAV